MIEKSKIMKGLFFWIDCGSILLSPKMMFVAAQDACLMEVEEVDGENVLCTVYSKEAFGAQTALTVGYIERNAKEVVLDSDDWEELIDIYNCIYSHHVYQAGVWTLERQLSLKIRINNLLCRDFYQKYNLERKENYD